MSRSINKVLVILSLLAGSSAFAQNYGYGSPGQQQLSPAQRASAASQIQQQRQRQTADWAMSGGAQGVSPWNQGAQPRSIYDQQGQPRVAIPPANGWNTSPSAPGAMQPNRPGSAAANQPSNARQAPGAQQISNDDATGTPDECRPARLGYDLCKFNGNWVEVPNGADSSVFDEYGNPVISAEKQQKFVSDLLKADPEFAKSLNHPRMKDPAMRPPY